MHTTDLEREAARMALPRQAHPFKTMGEYQLLKRIFYPKRKDAGMLPFLNQIKRLRELEERRPLLKERSDHSIVFYNNENLAQNAALSQWTARQSRFAQHVHETVTPETQAKLDSLARSSALTSLEVRTWLELNITASNDSHVIDTLFDECMVRLIEAATQRTLPVIMDFLATHWKTPFYGIIGSKSLRQLAESHVQLVFEHTLKLYPETEYLVEGDEIVAQPGITNLDSFKRFYENFILAFHIPHTISSLDDLWFQIVAQCDSIEHADNILVDMLNHHRFPSNRGIDIFIKALGKHIAAQQRIFSGSREEFMNNVKSHLFAYRSLLVSDQITPAVVEFLLMWTSTMEELYSVLDTATNAKAGDRIFGSCQPSILRAVVRCALESGHDQEELPVKNVGNSNNALVSPKIFVPVHARAMAHMFGVLNRFTKCSAGITSEALDECLILAAKYGNSAGMYKSLAMKLRLAEKNETSSNANNNISAQVLCQVFDSFPISAGAVAQEKKSSPSLWVVQDSILLDGARDQAILYHLRTMVDPIVDTDAFKKYIGALGRCGRSDRIYWEWQEFHGRSPEWVQSQDVVLEFISAYAASNEVSQGLAVIDAVLDISINHDAEQLYQASVSIIQNVFRYDVLPLVVVLRHAVNWFIRNKKSTKWSEEDIVKVFDEVGQSRTFTAHERVAASLIGQEVVRTILQCRNGLDVEESVTSFDGLLSAI